MGLFNIYIAPSEVAKRCVHWEHLKLVLPEHCKWIIGGDFNKVENVKDKTLKCGKMISNCERMVWEGLKTSLQVEEPKRSTRSLHSSWDNGRKQTRCIMARLDKMYRNVDSPLKPTLKSIRYIIRGNNERSNHHPASCEVEIFALVI